MTKNLTNSELNLRLIEVEKDLEVVKSDIEELKPVLAYQIEQKVQYGHIMQTLEELRTDVKSIKDKPAVYWDKIITAIISIVLTAIVAHFIHFK